MLDLIIEGGQLVDGTGAPARHADVGVRDGRIACVGLLAGMAAHQRVKAEGQVVAPGFIDVHTHDDHLLLGPDGALRPKLTQGVTTVVTGNCGLSLAPLLDGATPPPPPLDLLGSGAYRFSSFADYLNAVEAAQPEVNAACLVGHSTLRLRYMDNLDRPANAREEDAMKSDLARALRAGALGLSTGVYYPPARSATAQELIAVGQPLKAAGGLVAMHIRDEGDAIDEAMREALAVGRALDVPLVLSHHKLVGRVNHGRSVQTLALLEDAARGQPVCIDCYPYTASSTMLFPPRVNQSSDVLISWSQAEPAAAGRSLFAMARERGQTPEETARSLLPAGAIYFAMSEEDVSRILSHPLTMIGSDGLAHDGLPHPRLWGTFPRVLGHYVRERKLLALETAVHKMTLLGARRFGLHGRGQVSPGAHADLVIFDPARVHDSATFADPERAAQGIAAVYVNGELACSHGELTGARAGQLLRRSRAAM